MRVFECAAVLFDLDGVLVDSTERIRTVWTAWALEHGLDVEYVVHMAQGRRTIETLRAVAPRLDAEAELALIESAAPAASETEGVREVPGARELVAALPPARFAVVTSALRSTAELRLRHGGIEVPPVLVAADEVTRGKPHPEGFLAAAAHLGARPADCVVIEDAPVGIEAAHNGGMRVIAVATSHPPEALAAADIVVPSLLALRARVSGALVQIYVA